MPPQPGSALRRRRFRQRRRLPQPGLGRQDRPEHDPLHASVVTAAPVPLSPAGLGKKILLPLGAILGLILGIGAIFLRDRMDDRVRDRADLERCLEAPVLAGVPRIRRRAGSPATIFPGPRCRRRLRPTATSESASSHLLPPHPGGEGRWW